MAQGHISLLVLADRLGARPDRPRLFYLTSDGAFNALIAVDIVVIVNDVFLAEGNR
jgi:hypothetical protein